MKSKPLVDRLTSRMEDVDVYIIPDVQPLYKKKGHCFANRNRNLIGRI